MSVAGLRLSSPSGLSVELSECGALRRLQCGDILINLFPGNEVEGGPANLYLRRLGRNIESTPLLGPRGATRVQSDATGFRARGEWSGIGCTVSLSLAATAPAWSWQVELENRTRRGAVVDLLCAQDVGLALYDFLRLNEYYVSQYIDFAPLLHAGQGVLLGMRQNLSMSGRHPWLAIGSTRRGVGFATDALQLHGTSARCDAELPALQRRALGRKRLQHEHAMAVIQDAPLRLAPGESARLGFFGWFVADHPEPTAEADAACADRAIAALAESVASEGSATALTVRPETAPRNAAPSRRAPSEMSGGSSHGRTLFSTRPQLATRDLGDTELTALFGEERRHAEYRDGRLQSFFAGANTHIVLRDKELAVLRPHGHILRTGDHLTPDEASLTTTVWMGGVFNSLLTQGHVGIYRFLSTVHTYLGLFRSHGQRLFVELDGEYFLLGVPSAFAMTPDSCRWAYAHAGGLIEVETAASTHSQEIAVSVQVRGEPCRILWSHHIALDGDNGSGARPARVERDGAALVVRPAPDSYVGNRFPEGSFRLEPIAATVVEKVGGDELLYADGRSREQPFAVVVTAPSRSVGVRITGQLVPSATDHPIGGARAVIDASAAPLSSAPAVEVRGLGEIAPWLAHDALVHYLAPRGLEQFSGGAWGTRDVCQGPLEMLLALNATAPVRDLLLRVFAAQNPDGDWPQWFTFFERERQIRPDDSHGDIVYWPLLALGRYLQASADATILDARVPYFSGDPTLAESAPVWAHVERALAVMAVRRIPGTQLAAYGHGDWNDSLQPVDPRMREELCSAWTVTLQHDALTMLADGLAPLQPDRAAPLRELAKSVRDDFQRLLIADGVLAGFAHFPGPDRVDYLLHPRDSVTGIRYRLLPMIHAIAGKLLTAEQARRHVRLIRKHLLGADGARLFDRPPRYRGGLQQTFQRAESSTFFGREIGLMYVHAHLRYAEAMAVYGDAEAFFLALRQANPIAVDAVVRGARPRQLNCYYSSSDAAFVDRYDAEQHYSRVRRGGVAFEGGWRIYSSGAGIMLGLLHERLLGVRRTAAALVLDPVIPSALDGMRADVAIAGAPVSIEYRSGAHGCGPVALSLNGEPLDFEREENPYRPGAAIVPTNELRERLRVGDNTLVIQLS